jgi:signal transduction histidine kinase/ActR/RegA family two-component response regulator
VENRILIHAPIGKDARLIAQLFGRADIECHVCASLSHLLHELTNGAGALLVADEAITPEFLRTVGAFVANQEDWSDLPLVVMSQRGALPELQPRYLQLGNVSIVERPAQGVTLVSAARSVLRARQKQYAMRELDRRKDEFLAMLAHELRNPLAPIRAASDLLRLPTLDADKVQKTSEIISRQVRHMTGLIDDLLDLSRVSRGLVTLHEELLDARQIVINAVEQVRPLVDLKRHRLTIQTSHETAFIHADQKRLVQVIANILNNAARYTPEGGEITLATNIDHASVSYIVSDNGIGIAPNVIDRVFDMFAQAERSSDRSQGGLGIGLALVKNLVMLHRGSVSAFSEGVGKGSRFTVTLPRVADPDVDVEFREREIIPASDQHLRLLIVDDNDDAGHMLGLLLESAGYQVTVVQSASAGLERAESDAPDVFLLDIGLPEMDGNELARQLRKTPQGAKATLIAITGYGQEVDRKQTAAAGFDYHFVKPVDTQDLLSLLSKLTYSAP